MAKTVDELGSRMKEYENVPKTFLTLRTPKVVRLDMRSGHTFTKGFDRPYDKVFSECMQYATEQLCKNIPGVVLGYSQSDEISLIINDVTNRNKTNCFFNGNVEKIVSLTASECTLAFNQKYYELVTKHHMDNKIYTKNLWKARFDSRVFVLPDVIEVHNYILWRQMDATKNSISSLAHTLFTTKELNKKNGSEMQDMMMLQKGVNWNDYPVDFKRGFCYVKEIYFKNTVLKTGEVIENVKRQKWSKIEIPILTKDLNFIPDVFSGKVYFNEEFVEN